jgi:hypothetical protein
MRAFPPVDDSGGGDSWRKESGILPGGFMKIAVRLIDLCTNSMAGENTCLHSDHSLGRCLLYGAQVIDLDMYIAPVLLLKSFDFCFVFLR